MCCLTFTYIHSYLTISGAATSAAQAQRDMSPMSSTTILATPVDGLNGASSLSKSLFIKEAE